VKTFLLFFFWSPRRKIGDLCKNLCCSVTGNSARRSHRMRTAKVRDKQAVWKLLSKISRTAPAETFEAWNFAEELNEQFSHFSSQKSGKCSWRTLICFHETKHEADICHKISKTSSFKSSHTRAIFNELIIKLCYVIFPFLQPRDDRNSRYYLINWPCASQAWHTRTIIAWVNQSSCIEK